LAATQGVSNAMRVNLQQHTSFGERVAECNGLVDLNPTNPAHIDPQLLVDVAQLAPYKIMLVWVAIKKTPGYLMSHWLNPFRISPELDSGQSTPVHSDLEDPVYYPKWYVKHRQQQAAVDYSSDSSQEEKGYYPKWYVKHRQQQDAADLSDSSPEEKSYYSSDSSPEAKTYCPADIQRQEQAEDMEVPLERCFSSRESLERVEETLDTISA
jgi:hypothetical protein